MRLYKDDRVHAFGVTLDVHLVFTVVNFEYYLIIIAMRYSLPLMAALAATAAANGPAAVAEKRAEKMYTLELGPGETVEVTEDEKFQMIDVREPKT
jgi:hypothetical protein